MSAGWVSEDVGEGFGASGSNSIDELAGERSLSNATQGKVSEASSARVLTRSLTLKPSARALVMSESTLSGGAGSSRAISSASNARRCSTEILPSVQMMSWRVSSQRFDAGRRPRRRPNQLIEGDVFKDAVLRPPKPHPFVPGLPSNIPCSSVRDVPRRALVSIYRVHSGIAHAFL